MDKIIRKEMISNSPEETRAIAAGVAEDVKKGDVIVLTGNLGAGKTCFVQGFTKGFGVKEIVNSPSFAIVNVYSGKFPVYHMDFYRLTGVDEIRAIGCEDYFYGDGVCLIEWGERAVNLLPARRIEINFEMLDKNTREITFENFKY